MTKKDYIKIGTVIKEINQRKAKGYRIIELFADMLEDENKDFDREIFYKFTNYNKYL